MSEFEGRPLVAGTITGARTWRVDSLGRLTAITGTAEVWTPGVNEAECRRSAGRRGSWSVAYGSPSYRSILQYAVGGYIGGGNPGTVALDPVEEAGETKKHEVAASRCYCGFYAYTGDHIEHAHDGHILGLIQGSGVATVGSKGFRSSKAEIVALVTPNVETRLSRIAKWFWEHAFVFGPVGVGLALTAVLLSANEYDVFGMSTLVLSVPPLPVAALTLYGSLKTKQKTMPRELIDKVRRNYPDVRWFKSLAAATAAFPLPTEAEPTPADEDFWTRKAPDA